MYKRQIAQPKNNNNFDGFIGLIFLGLSIYSAFINNKNLEYNKLDAVASEKISEQLRTLNASHFMHKLNGEIERCEYERKKENE